MTPFEPDDRILPFLAERSWTVDEVAEALCLDPREAQESLDYLIDVDRTVSCGFGRHGELVYRPA